VLAAGKRASSPSAPSLAARKLESQQPDVDKGCLRAAVGGCGRALALRCARRPDARAGDGQTDASGGGSGLRLRGEVKRKTCTKMAVLSPTDHGVDGGPNPLKTGPQKGTTVVNLGASALTVQSTNANEGKATRTSRTCPQTWAELAPPLAVERYVGLDIGNKIELCELVDGTVTRRASLKTETDLGRLLGPDTKPALVVFEACRIGWHLYDLLTGWGHTVWMADTTRARQMGIGQHKRKNDRIDAEVLARAGESGRVPRAHILSYDSQQLRARLQVRENLVEMRARAVTAVRGLVRSNGSKIPSCATRDFVKKFDATPLSDSLREMLEPMIATLRVLTPQIDELDKQLDTRLKDVPLIGLLCTAPGVGRIVAAAFMSVVDDPGRFSRAHKLQAYLGLVPSENTSGKRRLGAITKQGNGYLRSLLVQAAWAVMRQRRSDPLKAWGQALGKRAGKRVAAVAVARRLAGILFAMWRDMSTYDREALAKNSARGKCFEAVNTISTAEQIAATKSA